LERCQRIGFISQGHLVALDSPARLKLTQMRGQVLEIRTPQPEKAMRTLKAAQTRGDIKLDEVALYGVQIHAVVSDQDLSKKILRETLEKEGIEVNAIEAIAPTLEDVFISSVNKPDEFEKMRKLRE
jgi:ABC-type multidrug transport system ATPase subunit